MTVASIRLAESLQALIDARLDTIDRMLLGRVPRADRLAIARDVEAQIFDLLQENGAEELGRDDVLAVLARLDPPEAYLPEGDDAGPSAVRDRGPFPTPARPAARSAPGLGVAKLGGILGLSTLALILLSPIIFLAAELLESEALLFIGGFGVGGLIFVGGLVSLILGVHARAHGVWAVLGMVTGVITLLFSGSAVLYMAILLAS